MHGAGRVHRRLAGPVAQIDLAFARHRHLEDAIGREVVLVGNGAGRFLHRIAHARHCLTTPGVGGRAVARTNGVGARERVTRGAVDVPVDGVHLRGLHGVDLHHAPRRRPLHVAIAADVEAEPGAEQPVALELVRVVHVLKLVGRVTPQVIASRGVELERLREIQRESAAENQDGAVVRAERAVAIVVVEAKLSRAGQQEGRDARHAPEVELRLAAPAGDPLGVVVVVGHALPVVAAQADHAAEVDAGARADEVLIVGVEVIVEVETTGHDLDRHAELSETELRRVIDVPAPADRHLHPAGHGPVVPQIVGLRIVGKRGARGELGEPEAVDAKHPVVDAELELHVARLTEAEAGARAQQDLPRHGTLIGVETQHAAARAHERMPLPRADVHEHIRAVRVEVDPLVHERATTGRGEAGAPQLRVDAVVREIEAAQRHVVAEDEGERAAVQKVVVEPEIVVPEHVLRRRHERIPDSLRLERARGERQQQRDDCRHEHEVACARAHRALSDRTEACVHGSSFLHGVHQRVAPSEEHATLRTRHRRELSLVRCDAPHNAGRQRRDA